MYQNTVNLSFMDTLQMRIIKERGLELDSLLGDEFQTLRDYTKLENRRKQLNNMDDFFSHGNINHDPFPTDD